MNKKRVVLDSSFLGHSKQGISAADGTNIIDKEFPDDEYDRVIHDYVLDEFFRDNPLSDANKNLVWREKNIQIYRANNLYMMESSHVIIWNEFHHKQNFDHLGKNLKREQDVLLSLAKKLPPYQQQHWEQQYQERIDERQKAKKEIFNKISIASKEHKVLKLEDLKERLSSLLKDGYRLPFHDTSYIEIIGEKVALKEKDKLKVTRTIKNLPSLYLFSIANLFLDKIKRPTISSEENSFKIKLPGIRDDVKIEENTIPDFQISLSGLHYCDVFATCDEAQAQLLKFLYPEYVDKIRYYKTNSQQKTYKEIPMSGL